MAKARTLHEVIAAFDLTVESDRDLLLQFAALDLEPLARLAIARRLGVLARVLEDEAIDEARKTFTWAQIGRVVGISKQAAQQRWEPSATARWDAALAAASDGCSAEASEKSRADGPYRA